MMLGSSPLARGLQQSPLDRQPRRRIIPARAGFTSAFDPVNDPGEDHPRSRGVYVSAAAQVGSVGGSSPLARGLRACPARIRGSRWIIPARAGFTAAVAGRRLCAEDHPRSRGVYSAHAARSDRRRGSSPLARGLLYPYTRPFPFYRIIPARAGFTTRMASRQAGRKDHPRSRGVYGRFWINKDGMYGSSPLARGLLFVTACIDLKAMDHPRSRGVYPVAGISVPSRRGSSPLARGLPRRFPT